MRRSILTVTAAVMMTAMVLMTTTPVLGQSITAGAGDTGAFSDPEQEAEAAFIDLVPVQDCLLDDQGGMVFRVMNQGRVWTAPTTITRVTLSTGGATLAPIDFPTDPIPPGGFVDLPLGAGPESFGADVVGFAISADATDQADELDEGNNTVGWACTG